MKIKVEYTFDVDTNAERSRIVKTFSPKSVERKKLLFLMDLIESGKWEEARKEIEGKWWDGRDRKGGFPRLEFLGHLNVSHPRVAWLSSYMNLIYWMTSDVVKSFYSVVDQNQYPRTETSSLFFHASPSSQRIHQLNNTSDLP